MTRQQYGTERIRIALKKKNRYSLGVIGAGDVGIQLLLGLRLLGCDVLSEIAFWEKNDAQAQRVLHELGIIRSSAQTFVPLSLKSDLSGEDIVIFSASAGVPELGAEKRGDVRLQQFHANARILGEWIRDLEERGFRGMYFILSDPVDFLCRYAAQELSISAQRIVGFGQGVMYARAAYYGGAQVHIYGPHGSGLWVANDPDRYNRALSIELTQKTRTENIYVRGLGYKPFIAPALCSGALSMLSLLRGERHYASHFFHGIYWGELYHPHEDGWGVQPIEDEALFADVRETADRCRHEYGKI